MLLSSYLSDMFHAFSVVHYISFRVVMAALTALICTLALGKPVIHLLQRMQMRQQIRDDGPASHFCKKGTPTMGGILILLGVVLSCLLWAHWQNFYFLWVFFGTLGFGLIGWVDDYYKVIRKNTKGLLSRWKYVWLSVLSIVAIAVLWGHADPQISFLYIPFVKAGIFDVGLWMAVLGYFVLVGSSNAVNLTDGLDGLAILPVVLIGMALGLFAYLSGHLHFAHYLVLPHMAGVGEVAVFCAALCGAGLGFLWFNCYPAQVFMGDVGSLALGGALGLVALSIHQECILFIMSGVFVAETVSVMLQVLSFKCLGKRVFRMAPLHHHFELLGWTEPKIVVRFWLITVILVLIGLSSLKLR